MTLQQLKYVIAVADKKSINEAAKSLYISQPSLSAAIKELENELNIVIFIRTNRGIITTPEGEEFLGYARQIIQQTIMVEERYIDIDKRQQHFSVSSQHYTFVANAFVNLIKKYSNKGYKFTFRETITYNIISDVRLLKSDLGVIFLNQYNQSFITKLLKDCNLEFSQLCETRPHVYVSKKNPLSKKKILTLDDLSGYPAIIFEQGEHNSLFLSEEVINHDSIENTITVSDRAALFDLLFASNAYAVSTGIYVNDPSVSDIISIPLDIDILIRLGVIHHRDIIRTQIVEDFWDELIAIIQKYNPNP